MWERLDPAVLVLSQFLAALADAGIENGAVTISVPGGELQVRFTPETSFLRGPSVIVAEGEYLEPYA